MFGDEYSQYSSPQGLVLFGKFTKVIFDLGTVASFALFLHMNEFSRDRVTQIK